MKKIFTGLAVAALLLAGQASGFVDMAAAQPLAQQRKLDAQVQRASERINSNRKALHAAAALARNYDREGLGRLLIRNGAPSNLRISWVDHLPGPDSTVALNTRCDGPPAEIVCVAMISSAVARQSRVARPIASRQFFWPGWPWPPAGQPPWLPVPWGSDCRTWALGCQGEPPWWW